METLDELTTRQHGHLSHDQLRSVLTGHAIRRRTARGLYEPVHRGVVRVASHPETELGRYAAALLAVGMPAALDGRAAARVYGVTALQPITTVHVVVPYQRVPRRLRGVHLHRTRRWERLAVTEVNGLAVPGPTATAARLASEVSERLLTDIVQDLLRRGLDLDELAAVAAGTLAGCQALRSVLSALSVSAKSALERLVFPALEEAGLSDFRRNVVVRDGAGEVIEEVDALFDRSRVAVQLDGWAFHHDRRRFQRDRTNQNRLAIETGLTVLRFTHDDATRRLPELVRQVRRAVEGRLPAEAAL